MLYIIKVKGIFSFFFFFWKWTTQHVWVDFVLLKGDCYSACTLMFTVALVTVAKPWNQRRGPWMDEQIKKIWNAIGHCFPIKNEIILLAGRGDYVKWDKLDLERGLPRDFSHTLNQGWGTVKKEKGAAEVGGGPRREEVEARATRVRTNMTKVCKMCVWKWRKESYYFV